MTEATAILDGGAGVVSGAGGGGAAPALVPAQGGGSNGSQPAAPWYAGADYTDEDRQILTSKGWDKGPAVPKPVLQSYANLEKIMGGKANAMILPKGDDAKGMAELMGKLGMPADAKDYKVELGDKADLFGKDELPLYQGIAHAAQMTNAQFASAIGKIAEARAAAEEKALVAYNGEVSRTKEKLNVELGDQMGEMIARGNLAMRQLGITPDQRDAMSQALGVEKATRILMEMGGLMAQHKAVGISNGGKAPDSFVTDKARAQDRIKTIKMLQPSSTGPDADFRKAMMDPGHPEHQSTTAQWREWQRIANS